MSSAGKMPVSAPASTAMLATARRSSIVSASRRPGRRTRARCRCRRSRRSRPSTARIRSLPATQRLFVPVNSIRIVPGRTCQNSPKARQHATSVEPSPVPKAPRAPCVQVRESPPATTEPGTTQPSSASTGARCRRAPAREDDALLVGPVLQPSLDLRRPRVLGRDEVVGDQHRPRGGRTRGPRPSPRIVAERHRPGDVVRHHDVAPHHHDVAWCQVVDLGVRRGGSSLASAPPQGRRPRPSRGRRLSRRPRSGSSKCRSGSVSSAMLDRGAGVRAAAAVEPGRRHGSAGSLHQQARSRRRSPRPARR